MMNEFNTNSGFPGLDEEIKPENTATPNQSEPESNIQNDDYNDYFGDDDFSQDYAQDNQGEDGSEQDSEGKKTYSRQEVEELLQKYNSDIKQELNTMRQTTTPQSNVPTNPLEAAKENLNAYINQQMQMTGMSREQVVQSLQAQIGGGQRNQNNSNVQFQMLQRQLQEMKQNQELEKFTERVTSFQKEMQLSDKDVEIFANKALEKGINLYYVQDYEPIFRGLFPEQYELRAKRRTASMSRPQFYGGSNPVNPNSRAQEQKQIDNIVNQIMSPFEKR